MTGDQFAKYEKHLSDTYKDATLAYHLTRIAYNLGPKYYHQISILSAEFIDFLTELFESIFAEDACWKMTGEISVGLVFVESSKTNGPKFSNSERNEICDEIIDGLNWLVSQHPGNNLSWVYDFKFPKIDASNGTDNASNCTGLSSLEAGWRDPAMAQINYNGNTYSAEWSSVAEFREDMRLQNRSKHAIVIFVTPYASCWHAYASQGRLVLAKCNDWGNWGRAALDSITAHEVCHLFGAADEYTGSGTPCSTCYSLHGCFDIPNGNCGACASPFQTCAMDGNALRLCEYTKGQIGWADLFVELTTADQNWAGTDDTVWLDIGDRTFVLDTLNHNDRERGNREGYAVWTPDLSLDQIKRVLSSSSNHLLMLF